jgi:hypothetical protein
VLKPRYGVWAVATTFLQKGDKKGKVPRGKSIIDALCSSGSLICSRFDVKESICFTRDGFLDEVWSFPWWL